MPEKTSPDPAIDIRLEFDEAVVLLALLSRWTENKSAATPSSACFVGTAEGAALNSLLALLEKQLLAPLREDYLEILERARARLAGNWDYPTLAG